MKRRIINMFVAFYIFSIIFQRSTYVIFVFSRSQPVQILSSSWLRYSKFFSRRYSFCSKRSNHFNHWWSPWSHRVNRYHLHHKIHPSNNLESRTNKFPTKILKNLLCRQNLKIFLADDCSFYFTRFGHHDLITMKQFPITADRVNKYHLRHKIHSSNNWKSSDKTIDGLTTNLPSLLTSFSLSNILLCSLVSTKGTHTITRGSLG